MKKLYDWYQQQKGIKKFSLRLAFNWVYWALVYLLIYFVINIGEQKSLKEYFITATFMAFIWTLTSIPLKRYFARKGNKA